MSINKNLNRFFIKLLTIFPIFLFPGSIINGQNPFRGDQCIVRTEFIYDSSSVWFPCCHASTIAETPEGFIAAWFGGTAEGNPDVGIWISRFSDGRWTIPEMAADGKTDSLRYPCWNPVLYFNGDEDLLLFYKVGPSPSEWWGELKTSTDNGKSWSPERKLPDGIIGPVKNKPVMAGNGMLLCPSSTENDGWRVHMEFTSDFGITWGRTGVLNDMEIHAIQPAILTHKSGKLQIVCRSRHSRILSSWSDDNGYTWSRLIPDTLPNPNSGIDAVTLKDGRHFLVYNHLEAGRNQLNAAVSYDGKTWHAALLLENDQPGTEYSYPAVIQSGDGLIHITYTWRRRLIRHVVVDPGKIAARPMMGRDWPSE
ncbi:MAG: exo-alpha-sialidase [Bacteroidales bacterium]|nr:exo-alpha-sialidase [Bacteroidales bacterium]